MLKDLIVSVESRKGGVGKTTAALCLGRVLLKKGYVVLVIDVDITGSNAADVARSSFWKDDLHIITVGKEPAPPNANFLNLFINRFMLAEAIPTFSCNNKNFNGQDRLSFNPARINVMGSQIYDQEIEGGITGCICKPEILFDELHGYWLLDFLKALVIDFIEKANNHHINTTGITGKNISPKPVAIILDNSPGYVGIAPNVQEWLTDIGPESGKFLVVSSLDTQDLHVCDMAISLLCQKYKKKVSISQEFRKISNFNGDNDGFDMELELVQDQFFMRLAENNSSKMVPIDDKNQGHVFQQDLYFYLNREMDIQQSFVSVPNNYMGAVINRVPMSVTKGRRICLPFTSNSKSRVLFQLLGGATSQGWKSRMIPYDEYIEYQFIQPGFTDKHTANSKTFSKLSETLENAEKQVEKIIRNRKQWNNIKNNLIPKELSNFREEFSTVQSIIEKCLQALRNAKLDDLANQIHEDWLPLSILKDFHSSSEAILSKAGFAYDDAHLQPVFKHYKYRNDSDDIQKLFHLFINSFSNIHSEIADPFNNDLFFSLFSLMLLSMGSYQRNKPSMV